MGSDDPSREASADRADAQRERRSRDRYGRDRRERTPRETSGTPETASSGLPDAPRAAAEDAPVQRRSYFDRSAASDAEPAAAEPAGEQTPTPVAAMVATVAAAIPATAPAAATATATPMPKVGVFELPLADLTRIAEDSGLQWVNSDAAKIAAAQAAMAAEPRAVHVPRERAPVVVPDYGPLVLVETKRDLREMTLPFEKAAEPEAAGANS
jgi:ribonuclease E